MLTFALVWPVIAPLIVISAVGLLGAAFRRSVLTWVTRAVEHRFNVDLEKVRSELRKSETQITSLASSVLSGRASREAVLQQRRIDAAEALWAAAVEIGRYRAAVAYLSVFNVSKVGPAAERDNRMRQVFQMIGRDLDLEKFPVSEGDKQRPFVTDLAWAYFSALRAIIASSVAQIKMLQLGADPTKFMHADGIATLAKVALPSHTDYIEKYGPAAYDKLLEPLETLLLAELRRIIEGAGQDEQAVANAAAIIRSAESAMSETLRATADAATGANR